jgi:Putative zinc-finger
MTCTIQHAGTIELYFYGELPPSERAAIETHLKRCDECRQALEDLSVIRSALSSRPDVASPPGGDWSAFMARLDDAVHHADGRLVRIDGRSSHRQTATSFKRRAAPYLAVAALLALATTAALLVFSKTGSTPTGGVAPISTKGPAPAAPVRAAGMSAPDAALVSLSGQHFQRSKLVLLGLTTKDATKPGQGDWTYERELATSLLGDTRLYRQAAEQRGMDTLAGVMRDLELVLLQTSMSEQPDRESLEQLQRLIQRRDLLTKMNALNSGGL